MATRVQSTNWRQLNRACACENWLTGWTVLTRCNYSTSYAYTRTRTACPARQVALYCGLLLVALIAFTLIVALGMRHLCLVRVRPFLLLTNVRVPVPALENSGVRLPLCTQKRTVTATTRASATEWTDAPRAANGLDGRVDEFVQLRARDTLRAEFHCAHRLPFSVSPCLVKWLGGSLRLRTVNLRHRCSRDARKPSSSRARLSSSVSVNVNVSMNVTARDSRAHRGARHQVLRELRAALHRAGAAAGHLQGLASGRARSHTPYRTHTPTVTRYTLHVTLHITRAVRRRWNIATLEHITQTCDTQSISKCNFLE